MNIGGANFYDDINSSNTQGLTADDYTTALNLKTEGLLSIDTGNFIIVSHDPIKINKNLRKLNGGWFVYGLRHSFSVKDFRTEIACTKFYEIKKDE